MSILQGTIPDDWEGEYCRYAVCWPNSPQWLAVLRGVLFLPARGRFWDEHTGVITEAQQVMQETLDTNLHLQEVILACNDASLLQIAAALDRIAASMLATNGGCCERQGSGGAPTSAPPFSPIVPGDPMTDDPPPGFETWEEYQIYKCAIAWDIVGNLESDIGEMAIVNLGGVTLSSLASVLAIAFITPIPFDDVIAIAGLLLTVAAEVVIATTLSLVNDNEEDLICALYEGTDSSTSRSMFLSKYAEFVTAGVADPVTAFAVNSLMAFMLSSAGTNRLYEKDNSRVWAEQDCSMCGPNGDFRQGQANGLEYADWDIIGTFEIGVPYELTSQLWEIPPASDAQAVVLELANNQITATFEQSAHVQYTIEGCGDYRAGSGVGGGHAGQDDLYCEIYDLPAGELTFGNITFYSLDPASFTLTITRTA